MKVIKVQYRRWLPTDMNALFDFSFLVLFLRILLFVVFLNLIGLSIQVYLNASQRKEGRSHRLYILMQQEFFMLQFYQVFLYITYFTTNLIAFNMILKILLFKVFEDNSFLQIMKEGFDSLSICHFR